MHNSDSESKFGYELGEHKKHREFWIDEKTVQLKHCHKLVHQVRLYEPYELDNEFEGREPIHVVEHKALEDAQAEIAELKAKLEQEEKDSLKLIDERDHWEERINNIADTLGDEREWTSHNDRSDNCIEGICALQAEIASLQASNGELERSLAIALNMWEAYMIQTEMGMNTGLSKAETESFNECNNTLSKLKSAKGEL